MPRLTPIDAIHECLNKKENFALQGGAGSGKTETLKRTLAYISQEYPAAKVACITHTNFAVKQITDRVGDKYTISTIHSFLNNLTKEYKKNIHQIIHKIFCVEPIIRTSIEDHADEKSFKKYEHKQYESAYEKYAKRLYQLKKETIPKVTGKRDYDRNPETYNAETNELIDRLNEEIEADIEQKNYSSIEYNETQFDSLSDLTYGHDGLLKIACILVEEFKLLRKIIADKYDYILIDEYQDTNPDVIHMFIENVSIEGPLLGLFGDSVQAIYEDGIGDVNQYIDQGLIKKIEKEDNYRCSQQVIKFANQIRYDGLSQKVAFKRKDCGQPETIEDRQGKVELFYGFEPIKPVRPKKPAKPNANASDNKIEKYETDLIEFENEIIQYDEDYKIYRKEYSQKLDGLIKFAQKDRGIEYTVLKLTNKSIARDAGFSTLFEIFDDRYIQGKDEIEKKLSLWQFESLFKLCDAYQPFSNSPEAKPNYNKVINQLKQSGFRLNTLKDKKIIKEHILAICNSERGAFETLEKAFSLGLLKKSDGFESHITRENVELSFYEVDELHNSFKEIYNNGGNTFNRFVAHSEVIAHEELINFQEEDYNEKVRDLKKETFLKRILADEISFKEVLNYYCYLNEYFPFITMHKTKGGEIDNVLVVLDEYFWTKYNFLHAFMPEIEQSKKEKNANLVYVACTRAKTNLRTVRLVKNDEEETLFLSFFPNAVKVDLNVMERE